MIDQRGLKVAVTLPSRGEREVLNELPFEIALFGHWNDHIGSSDRPTIDKMRCRSMTSGCAGWAGRLSSERQPKEQPCGTRYNGAR